MIPSAQTSGAPSTHAHTRTHTYTRAPVSIPVLLTTSLQGGDVPPLPSSSHPPLRSQITNTQMTSPYPGLLGHIFRRKCKCPSGLGEAGALEGERCVSRAQKDGRRCPCPEAPLGQRRERVGNRGQDSSPPGRAAVRAGGEPRGSRWWERGSPGNVLCLWNVNTAASLTDQDFSATGSW